MDERDNVSKQRCRMASKRTSSLLILFIGTVQMIWLSLQRPRQLRRRWGSTWGSSRSDNWSWQTSILSTLLATDEAKKRLFHKLVYPTVQRRQTPQYILFYFISACYKKHYIENTRGQIPKVIVNMVQFRTKGTLSRLCVCFHTHVKL